MPSLFAFAPAVPPVPAPTNQERLYALSFAEADVQTLLARLVCVFVYADLMGKPLVCSCLDLELIDRLVPEEPCNMVLTRSEHQMLSAFVGAVSIAQSRQKEPLVAGYTRPEIGQLLSRFFFLPLTRLHPFLSI